MFLDYRSRAHPLCGFHSSPPLDTCTVSLIFPFEIDHTLIVLVSPVLFARHRKGVQTLKPKTHAASRRCSWYVTHSAIILACMLLARDTSCHHAFIHDSHARASS